MGYKISSGLRKIELQWIKKHCYISKKRFYSKAYSVCDDIDVLVCALHHRSESVALSPHAYWPYAVSMGDTILLAYDLGVRRLCQYKHGVHTPDETLRSRMCNFCGATSQWALILPSLVTVAHTWYTHTHKMYTHTPTHTLSGVLFCQRLYWRSRACLNLSCHRLLLLYPSCSLVGFGLC